MNALEFELSRMWMKRPCMTNGFKALIYLSFLFFLEEAQEISTIVGNARGLPYIFEVKSCLSLSRRKNLDVKISKFNRECPLSSTPGKA